MAIDPKYLRKFEKKRIYYEIPEKRKFEKKRIYYEIPKKEELFTDKFSNLRRLEELEDPFFDVARSVHQKQVDMAYQQANDAYAKLFTAYVDLAREAGREVTAEVMDAFNQIGAEIEMARHGSLTAHLGIEGSVYEGLARRKETPIE